MAGEEAAEADSAGAPAFAKAGRMHAAATTMALLVTVLIGHTFARFSPMAQ